MNIIRQISEYYTEKIELLGATPQGVDWNSAESQILRFEQLAILINKDKNPFSVLDYGCGYGALYSFLSERFVKFDYTGYDISKKMIEEAKKQNDCRSTHWTNEANRIKLHDYLVSSGVFNVKLDNSIKAWEEYLFSALNQFNNLSVKGFAFNILTKYSDKEFMKDSLYYADPCVVFNYCKLNFSKYVSLYHDYPLYEFTIIVRK